MVHVKKIYFAVIVLLALAALALVYVYYAKKKTETKLSESEQINVLFQLDQPTANLSEAQRAQITKDFSKNKTTEVQVSDEELSKFFQ